MLFSKCSRLRPTHIAMLGAVLALCSGCSENEQDNDSRLNDTGITWGGDYPKDINEDCTAEVNRRQLEEMVPGETVEGDILAQQDCRYGRDATANDDRDGAAGFVYRKISADGKKLDADAETWDCVLDEVTELLWEAKKAPDSVYGNLGLHDGDDLFTWYNSTIRANGGLIGDWNSRFDQCAGYKSSQPMTYCNIEEFVRRVNEQGLCGFKDWRVPALPELATLVHFGSSRPAIDTVYFPHTLNEFYWTISPNANVPQTAWAVTFQYGYAGPMRRTDTRPVRLVRKWNSEPGKSSELK